ncbi:MAG: PAS domain-containing protein, partial [Rudanella sp.]|nr:PAS domain-containing protein [Rudanella sp.]
MSSTSTPTPLSPLTTLSSSLDSLVIYHAVRDNTDQIVDFRLATVSNSPLRLWNHPHTNPIGERISQLAQKQDAPYLIRQLSLIMDSGRAVRFDMDCHWQHDGSGHRCEVMASKLEDGVLISSGRIADPVAGIDSEEQSHDRFIESILNSVTCGVVVCRVIRRADGTVDDFLFTTVNDEAARFVQLTVADMVGKPLGKLFPGIYKTGVFAFYARTIETGVPDSMEIHYELDGLNVWANLKTTKLGDGLVITWTDVSEYRRTEETLRQRTALLESVQNSSKVGISSHKAIRNEAGQIIDFKPLFRNEVNARMANLPPDKATAQTLVELLSTSVRLSADMSLSLAEQEALMRESPFFKTYSRVAETGVSSQFVQTTFVDGVEKSFDVVVSAWQDGVVANALDMTELRRAEREKIKLAEFNRTVLDTVQTAVSAYDAVRDERGQIIDFRITLVNAVFLVQTGRPETEVVGCLLTEAFPNTIQTGLLTRYIAVVETGQSQPYELHYNHDGLDVWVLGTVSACGDGVVISSVDVTKQKQAEITLQQQNDLLEQVMNTTPTAIVVNESIRNEAGEIVDFRMIRLNQTAATLVQLPIEKVLHRRMSQFFPGILETPLFALYKEVVATGKPARMEFPRGKGWYDFSVARLNDGIVVVTQDITAMREQRQQLEKANHELKRSNESLQSFAFIASHDLQEPLRKITSFSNVLHTQYAGQFNVGATDVIRRINDSAKRMRLLIHDLLDYSRIETRQELFKPVNLTALLDVLRENELWAAFHQSKAVIEHLNLPVPLADPLQMRQLFQNLLSNAIKFCPNDTIPIIKVSSRVIDRADVPAGFGLTHRGGGWQNP